MAYPLRTHMIMAHHTFLSFIILRKLNVVLLLSPFNSMLPFIYIISLGRLCGVSLCLFCLPKPFFMRLRNCSHLFLMLAINVILFPFFIVSHMFGLCYYYYHSVELYLLHNLITNGRRF